MPFGPTKTAEAVVARLIPPACREEVLGDLFERYRSPRQYAIDVLRTLPLVIAGRMRRAAEPQALLIQAFGLYFAFLAAASFYDGALYPPQLWRLAVPAASTVCVLLLDDAYARPGKRSPFSLVRGPLLGLGLALLAPLPLRTLLAGSALGFVFSSWIRLAFPPARREVK